VPEQAFQLNHTGGKKNSSNINSRLYSNKRPSSRVQCLQDSHTSNSWWCRHYRHKFTCEYQ